MSTHAGPNIVESGLVLAYDMSNTKKSWMGKPTTNYIYLQNPRIDSSYATYSATSSGTWNAKHPNAITVYNQSGGNISAYSNSGVTDWTNTYHAHWQYDNTLNKPVVVMENFDGQWKAKSFSMGYTFAQMGLTNGSSYSISWLQWTDDIAKSANSGVYSYRISDSVRNFYDGLSNAQGSSYNTLPYTWQRVYATFTVSADTDTTKSLSLYMYGHYGSRRTIKIADVQLETGTDSGFLNALTRSNTESIIDMTGNSTLTATSLTYASGNTFSFNASNNDRITTSVPLTNFAALSSWSMSAWFKATSLPPNLYNGVIVGATYYSGTAIYWRTDSDILRVFGFIRGNDAYRSTAKYNCEIGTVYNFVIVRDSTLNTFSLYVNGKLFSSVTGPTQEYNSSYATIAGNIGISKNQVDGGGAETNRYFTGDIYSVQLYNDALSANEISTNFNALRGRYGI